MNVFECVRKCRTTRAYKAKEAPLGVIKRILEAGRLSPSARNQQPWHFIVIRKREVLEKIAALSLSGRHIAKASFAIAVITDPSNRWHEIDGARAVQNMTLVAWEEGLGNCWVGAIERDKVKDLLRVPKELNLLTVLPFGYPEEEKVRRKKNRRSFDEVAFLEEFGQKFEKAS